MSHSVELKMNSQVVSANKTFLALLALFIIPISGLSIDIYVPSLPNVSHFFGVSKSLAQLTITFYMIGLGFMQMIAGSISDSFGRRKPFLIAMLLYLVATLLIPFVHHIQQLLFLRLIQGVTVAVIVVPMRSVVADLFEGTAYYKMMNYMTMAWSIGPIIAPAIGGYLQHYFGWHASFYFLGIYGIFSFILIAVYLPDTSSHHHPFHLRKILGRYKEILFNQKYLIGLAMNSILYSLVILFTVVAPFLIQNVLHYSAIEFGRFALLTGFAWFLGTMINRFLINIPLQTKSSVGLSVMLAIVIGCLLAELWFPMNIYFVMVPIILLFITGGTLFPNYFARSMSLFPRMTGSANALFGGFLFLISGASSGFGTFLKFTTEMPLMISYLILLSLCIVLHCLDCYKVRQQSNK